MTFLNLTGRMPAPLKSISIVSRRVWGFLILVTIPQYDGADNSVEENEEDGVEPLAKRSKAAEGDVATPEERSLPDAADELGSDLDDEDELNDEVDDENISDLILCQYEKISRVRTRWRGVLRAGIIHIGGSDFAFSRATTDFDW